MPICKGEEVLLNASHTETSISYNLKPKIPRTEVTQDNLNTEDFQLILPPERIAIYGDGEWRLCMLTAIRNAVRSLSLLGAFSHQKLTYSSTQVHMHPGIF